MKASLMHADRDVDLLTDLPANAAALTQESGWTYFAWPWHGVTGLFSRCPGGPSY
jgi:hypothetical protein